MTDRYENKNKTYLCNKPKKRNIIANIYNYKYQNNHNNNIAKNIIRNKRYEKKKKRLTKSLLIQALALIKQMMK